MKFLLDGLVAARATPKGPREILGSWVAVTDGTLEPAKRLGHSSCAITSKYFVRSMAGMDVLFTSDLDALCQGLRSIKRSA